MDEVEEDLPAEVVDVGGPVRRRRRRGTGTKLIDDGLTARHPTVKPNRA